MYIKGIAHRRVGTLLSEGSEHNECNIMKLVPVAILVWIGYYLLTPLSRDVCVTAFLMIDEYSILHELVAAHVALFSAIPWAFITYPREYI